MTIHTKATEINLPRTFINFGTFVIMRNFLKISLCLVWTTASLSFSHHSYATIGRTFLTQRAQISFSDTDKNINNINNNENDNIHYIKNTKESRRFPRNKNRILMTYAGSDPYTAVMIVPTGIGTSLSHSFICFILIPFLLPLIPLLLIHPISLPSSPLSHPSHPSHPSLLAIPIALGASIGGYAGDALPSAR